MTILKMTFVTLALAGATGHVATAQTAAPRGEPVAGMSCDAMEGSRVHIHQHLTILDHGNLVPIPPNIGQPAEKPCIYWVHTHTPDGVIHIEAPQFRSFTLGDFFAVWGQTLTRTQAATARAAKGQSLRVWVNGTRYTGDPRAIPLAAHTDVVIEAGPPFPKPPRFTTWGNALDMQRLFRARHSLSGRLIAAWLFGAAPLAAQGHAGSAQVVPPLAARWWNVVTVLADDSLRGRASGTEDYLKAARYVAQEFQKAGLAPAGTDGYLQTAHLSTARLVAEHSGIALVTNGVADTLKLGTDASITLSTTTAARAEGPMVFVGYGLHFPGIRDDLAGTSVRGKVAVYLNRLPSHLTATIMAHSRSGRWEALRAAGAIAAIAITEPPVAGGRGGAGGPPGGGGRPANGLADDPTGGGVMITVPDSESARLFAGSGHTYAELVAMANKDSAAVLPTFPLVPTLRVWTELAKTPLEAPNVLGMLRGSDPALRDQYVIVSAHLDHLGVGRAVDGDSIYNGAMDNASGIATMIETARAFHDRQISPKRSIIFAAVTAEEKGELGSAYFATHPTVPVGQIVADLNTDMWEPQIPLVGIFGYGADESDLGNDLRQALRLHNLTLMEDPHPEQVRFIRSDQYSFIKRGIPALALKIGYLPGSPGDSVIAEWNRVRYHKPSDDVDQPVNFEAAIGFDAMYIDLVHLVADRPTRPAWVKGSVFATGARP